MREAKQYRMDPKAIIVRADRDLPLNAAGLEMIRQSVRETGEIRDAIHVRKVKDGVELIDGLHRREAAILEGLAEVEVKERACTLEQARLMQADANVTFTHMSAVDLAVGLASRKRHYEALYPETKHGIAGSVGKHDLQRTLMSFADFMADVVEVTPRQIRRIVAAGEALTSADVTALRKIDKPVRMNDLYVIAKAKGDDQKRQIIDAIAAGNAKSASDAMRALKEPNPPVQDPVEAAFKALRQAWARAPKDARRRFVSAERREIDGLLQDVITDDLRDYVEGGDT